MLPLRHRSPRAPLTFVLAALLTAAALAAGARGAHAQLVRVETDDLRMTYPSPMSRTSRRTPRAASRTACASTSSSGATARPSP
jgi:hypothetical protein